MKVHQKRFPDNGKIEKLVLALRSTDSANAGVLDKIRTEANYFERNAERMRYPKFRGQHLLVRSGVIDANADRYRFAPETIRHVLDRPWR